MNPYVFFVGCPRSGTTLLARLGDAHPELAIIRELHWLPRWWERRVGLTDEGIVTPRLVAKLCRHSRFSRLELGAADIDALVQEGAPKHYARFVTELFDLYGQVRGKRLVGEKTPAYVRSLPTLHALWPKAKVVHLIRDGRDVALSLLDWSRSDRAAGRFPTWDEDRLTTSALFWEWNVRLGREAAASLTPDRYYELRYESLVSDPETECAQLCGFLGVDYDAAMLGFHRGRMRSKKPGPRRPVTPGLRRWKEQMTPGDVARFQAVAGPLLDELGYDRGARSTPGDDVARAGRLRNEFTSAARALRWAVPETWEKVAA